jgi:HTH-type transcriptional regulator/antitoxin HigA
MKPLKPIRNQEEYDEALREIEPFFDSEPEPDTLEGNHFEILAMLIEDYEAKHWPIDAPDPVEAIRYRMEQSDLKPKDLTPMIGNLNRVYEILGHKRMLTLPMIRRLNRDLHIPAQSLIGRSCGAITKPG